MAEALPETDDRLLKVSEVAYYLRLSAMTVYRLIRKEELNAIRVGRSWRVRESELAAYLQQASQ